VTVVDAHCHLGLERFIVRPISAEKRSWPAFKDRMEQEGARLVAAMDRNGVAKAVAFPFPLSEVDEVAANEYVLAAAREHPGRIIPFALLGPGIGRWIEAGARGFKQHFLLEPERFDLGKLYAMIEESGLPLIAHLPTKAIVAGAEAILKAAPRIKLVIAHMGRCVPNTSQCVEENLAGLARYPNVYFESSTVRDPAAFRRAVDLLGPGRLCFGSDMPFFSHLEDDPLSSELEAMRRASFSAAEAEAVLGGNIMKLVEGGAP
jgi:predicted TIM-barrel fold metal-dependent hydrolase